VYEIWVCVVFPIFLSSLQVSLVNIILFPFKITISTLRFLLSSFSLSFSVLHDLYYYKENIEFLVQKYSCCHLVFIYIVYMERTENKFP